MHSWRIVLAWVLRVLLLGTAPVFYLCRFIANLLSDLDLWASRTILQARKTGANHEGIGQQHKNPLITSLANEQARLHFRR